MLQLRHPQEISQFAGQMPTTTQVRSFRSSAQLGMPMISKSFPGRSGVRHSAADAMTSPDSRFSTPGSERIVDSSVGKSSREGTTILSTSRLKLHGAPASRVRDLRARIRAHQRPSRPRTPFPGALHDLQPSGDSIRYEMVEGKKDLISKRDAG